MSNSVPLYHDYRQRFLDAATAKGFEIDSVQHERLSPQGKPIFTDFAYPKNHNENLPTLIHISGTHGIEGYIGSDIQTDILKNLPDNFFNFANVIFVHSINAYGMAWYRRVNSNNVDLNRNSFNAPIKNPEFVEFAEVLNKNSKAKFSQFFKLFFKRAFRIGFANAMQIVAKGQCDYPDSMFFSGLTLQPEVIRFENKIKTLVKSPKEIFVVDVHSGLGAPAEDTLVLDGFDSDETEARFQSMLHRKIIVPQKNSNFYRAEGVLSWALKKTFPNHKVHHVVEEFGTRPIYRMFPALFFENQNFDPNKVHPDCALKMLDSYYLPTEKLKRKAIETGKHLFTRLLLQIAK